MIYKLLAIASVYISLNAYPAENLFQPNLLLKCEGQGKNPAARLVIIASSFASTDSFELGTAYLIPSTNQQPQSFDSLSLLARPRGFRLYDESTPTTEDRFVIVLSQTGSLNGALEYKASRHAQLNLLSTDFLTTEGKLKEKIVFNARLHVGTPLTDAARLGFTQRDPLAQETLRPKDGAKEFQFICQVQTL